MPGTEQLTLPAMERAPEACALCMDRVATDRADAIARMPDGRPCCAACAEDQGYFVCERCGELEDGDSAISVWNATGPGCSEPESWCEACADEDAYVCEGCGEYHITRGRFCGDCCDDWYVCETCGAPVYVDDVRSGADDDGAYCEGCAPSDADDTRGLRLRDYSYRPSPIYRDTGRDRPGLFATVMYLGLEVEAEIARADVSDVREILEDGPSWCYYKHDGSLRNGFEIVTHPATWERWREKDGEELASMLGRLARAGCEAYNTGRCGLHVHISKDALTPLHVYKALTAVQDNPALILAISRRSAGELEHWASPTLGIRSTLKAHAARYKAGTARNAAINLCPPTTAEVRICRSTLDRTGFWRCLEAVRSLWAWTAEASLGQLTGRYWREYAEDNRKEYPVFAAYLGREEVMPLCV